MQQRSSSLTPASASLGLGIRDGNLVGDYSSLLSLGSQVMEAPEPS